MTVKRVNTARGGRKWFSLFPPNSPLKLPLRLFFFSYRIFSFFKVETCHWLLSGRKRRKREVDARQNKMAASSNRFKCTNFLLFFQVYYKSTTRTLVAIKNDADRDLDVSTTKLERSIIFCSLDKMSNTKYYSNV